LLKITNIAHLRNCIIRMKYFFSMIIVLLFIQVIILPNAGCKKDAPPATDTIKRVDTIIPKPVVDTPIYISKLERGTLHRNQTNTFDFTSYQTYSFYYDNSKRLTSIGIRYLGGFLLDTATCTISYNGNDTKPSRMILPNKNPGNTSVPVVYDTIFYFYNANGQIIKDTSTFFAYDANTSSYIRKPAKKEYFYIDSSRVFIKHYGVYNLSVGLQVIRIDTIEQIRNREMSRLKSQFFGAGTRKINAGVIDYFGYTSYVNPLAKLNLPQSINVPIIAPSHFDILGSFFDVDNSSVALIPDYFDFYSNKILSRYVMTSLWNGLTQFPFSSDFQMNITPYQNKPSYPSSITIFSQSSTNDSAIIRYNYIK
jgi:hypothetical protein